VRILVVAADARDELRVGGIGDVPDLVRQAAERAQEIDRVRIALWDASAVAHARHLRATALRTTFRAGNVRQIFRLPCVGDVHDRRTVEFRRAADRIHRLAVIAGAVVADIGDVTIALLVNGRLGRRCALADR